MEELIVQNDGCYALCFKNFNKLSPEEVDKIFTKYGDVHSIRQSSETVPWVFIRYKQKEEAQKALDDLQGYKNFDIRVAKSYAKKKQDHDGDREKSDTITEGSRDNRSIKGSMNRNKASERYVMDSDDNESVDAKDSPNQAPYNRKRNTFAERPNKNGNNGCNERDRGDEVEGARALFSRTELTSSKNQDKFNGKHSRGREDTENFRRSLDSSPPRLVKRYPGNQCINDAVENRKKPEFGPPKLVKGSEYYASNNQASPTTCGLALRAAYEEVWANHPLRSEMQLREVIMTNFVHIPSKKDIYNFCSPVKPLHVSFGRTGSQSVFCRVLVATEGDVEHLCSLSSDEVFVTILEDLLDSVFLNE